MKKISWSLLRSRLEPPLELELRVCIELLWVLPSPGAPLPATFLPNAPLLPSNVLVGVDGTVSLESALSLESAREAQSSTRYRAPELSSGGSASKSAQAMLASAIYAVGALLFEAVSGKAFVSSQEIEREIRYARARAAATGLADDIAEIELLEIAAKATRAIPELRWPSPEAFSRALDRAAAHRMATREALARVVSSLLAPDQATLPPPPPSAPSSIPSRIKTLRGIAIDSNWSPRWLAPKRNEEEATEAATGRCIHPMVELQTSFGRRNQRLALAGLIVTMVVALPLAFMGVSSWSAPAHTTNAKGAPLLEAQRPAPRSTAASVSSPPKVLFSEPVDAASAPCVIPRQGANGGGALESRAPRDQPRPLAKPTPHRTERRIPDYGI